MNILWKYLSQFIVGNEGEGFFNSLGITMTDGIAKGQKVNDNAYELNPSKKETPHSFKGQQLENKSLYRFVISMSFLEKFLSYNLTLSL